MTDKSLRESLIVNSAAFWTTIREISDNQGFYIPFFKSILSKGGHIKSAFEDGFINFVSIWIKVMTIYKDNAYKNADGLDFRYLKFSSFELDF